MEPHRRIELRSPVWRTGASPQCLQGTVPPLRVERRTSRVSTERSCRTELRRHAGGFSSTASRRRECPPHLPQAGSLAVGKQRLELRPPGPRPGALTLTRHPVRRGLRISQQCPHQLSRVFKVPEDPVARLTEKTPTEFATASEFRWASPVVVVDGQSFGDATHRAAATLPCKERRVVLFGNPVPLEPLPEREVAVVGRVLVLVIPGQRAGV